MNRTNWKSLALAVAACWALCSTTEAASIGVSYAGDNTGGTAIQITPSQTAGVVPQTNWNAATGATGGALLLNDDAGAGTTASVTWTSANTWGGSAATTDDEAMVNGWLDDGGNPAGSTTSVTGIPYALYDVYVYGSSDAGNDDRGWVTDINGTLIASEPNIFGAANLSANGSYFDGSTYVDAQSSSDAPNYAVLRGLSGANLTILGVRQVVNGLDSRGAVAGFQIVEVPEPTSLVLLGVGAVVGFGLRKRK